MVSNKHRLYIALYPSGVANSEEKRYHWAFLIGPKADDKKHVTGMRYHVKNSPDLGWIYEAVPLDNILITNNLLARFVIAKIEDEKRLVEILRRARIVQNDPQFRCRTWIAGALEDISDDGKAVGTAKLDWTEIEDSARNYVAQKTAAGRYLNAAKLLLPRPTWDMIEGKEIIS